jgi:serine/threonine-protein kinase HipA
VNDTDTLNLWHEQRRVGQLWRNPAGAIGFCYEPEWIAGGGFADGTEARAGRHGRRAGGPRIRPGRRPAQRWFANLLPEGAVREHIVRDLKLPNTDFDLLRVPEQ